VCSSSKIEYGIKQLPKQFQGRGEVRGIHFSQLRREGSVCLYKRSDGYYEIVKLRIQKASSRIINGVKIEFQEKEIYPSGDSWNGKCVKSKNYALELYENMLRGT